MNREDSRRPFRGSGPLSLSASLPRLPRRRRRWWRRLKQRIHLSQRVVAVRTMTVRRKTSSQTENPQGYLAHLIRQVRKRRLNSIGVPLRTSTSAPFLSALVPGLLLALEASSIQVIKSNHHIPLQVPQIRPHQGLTNNHRNCPKHCHFLDPLIRSKKYTSRSKCRNSLLVEGHHQRKVNRDNQPGNQIHQALAN